MANTSGRAPSPSSASSASSASSPWAVDLIALVGAGLKWTPLHDGIDICRLFGDGIEGPSAAFVRYRANARLPRHEHGGYEYVFVLSGSQEDESGVYPAGTIYVSRPGSKHSVLAKDGCVAFVLWERPVTFLKSAEPPPA